MALWVGEVIENIVIYIFRYSYRILLTRQRNSRVTVSNEDLAYGWDVVVYSWLATWW